MPGARWAEGENPHASRPELPENARTLVTSAVQGPVGSSTGGRPHLASVTLRALRGGRQLNAALAEAIADSPAHCRRTAFMAGEVADPGTRDQTAGAGYVGYSTPETCWTTRMTWQE